MDLQQLDDTLYNYFTSLKSNIIDFNKITSFLKEYNKDDWKKYIVNSNENYVKKIVPSKYNQQLYVIIVITWNSNKYTKIHNHAENGCVFKILSGSLLESRYNKNLKLIKSNSLEENCISYIHNNIGFHSINTNNNNCVSIHVYSPANYNTIFLE